MKGGTHMKVVNPLNKTPLTYETMVNSCHCVCTSLSGVSHVGGTVPIGGNCGCSCGKGSVNQNGNNNQASDA